MTAKRPPIHPIFRSDRAHQPWTRRRRLGFPSRTQAREAVVLDIAVPSATARPPSLSRGAGHVLAIPPVAGSLTDHDPLTPPPVEPIPQTAAGEEGARCARAEVA